MRFVTGSFPILKMWVFSDQKLCSLQYGFNLLGGKKKKKENLEENTCFITAAAAAAERGLES